MICKSEIEGLKVIDHHTELCVIGGGFSGNVCGNQCSKKRNQGCSDA